MFLVNLGNVKELITNTNLLLPLEKFSDDVVVLVSSFMLENNDFINFAVTSQTPNGILRNQTSLNLSGLMVYQLVPAELLPKKLKHYGHFGILRKERTAKYVSRTITHEM